MFVRRLVLAATAVCMVNNPAHSEVGFTFDQAANNIMKPACEILQIMRYQKVDGAWQGGRSLLKGELPVTGPGAARLARSRMYIFDAHRLRLQQQFLTGAAKVVNIEHPLFPDLLSAEFYLEDLDQLTKRLMADFDSDPLSNCDRYRAGTAGTGFPSAEVE